MRVTSVCWALVLLGCLCVSVSAVDVEPAPSFTHVKPLNHFMPVIAKRALPQEVKNERNKQEWNELENLLKKEPESAGGHDIDLLLDDLEKKYMKDKTPKDASLLEHSSEDHSFAETSSASVTNTNLEATLQSKLSELKEILPKQEMRLKQLKQKLGLHASKPVKQFKKDFHAEQKQKQLAKDAISTLALVDKRVNSLQRLVGRLYNQLGLTRGGKLTGPQLVAKAMKDRKKEKAQAAKDAHDMKVDLALKAKSFLEASSNSDAESEADSEAEADSKHAAAVEHETEQLIQQESQAESTTDSEAELEADAEVVEQLMAEMM